MDPTKREITKIAREIARFTVRAMRREGVGTAEFDFIHAVRHHPGITQAEIRTQLGLDKGACARQAARLEAKGFLVRKKNPGDGRSRCLYATPQAEALKTSKATIEAISYEWLLEGLSSQEQQQFCRLLEILYERSRRESRSGFPNLSGRLQEVQNQ
jgi:DNA-binding MarR family transcriptional regulator